MKPILLAATLTMIAGQSDALSCMRPDPIRAFQQLADAPERYFVIYGTLTFDAAALPDGVSDEQTRNPDPIPARFVGKGLSQGGFVTDYISDVTLQIGCLGPWCGSARSGTEAVIFVQADNSPVTIEADPCNSWIFEEPSQTVLDQLTTCMQGGACSPQPFQ